MDLLITLLLVGIYICEASYFPQDSGGYSFSYLVSDAVSGSQFGHREDRAAAGQLTAGSYHVLLPDGRIQTVNYSVQGPKGYQAEVNYGASVEDGHPSLSQPTPLPSETHPTYLSYSPVRSLPPVNRLRTRVKAKKLHLYTPQSYVPAPVVGRAYHPVHNLMVTRPLHKKTHKVRMESVHVKPLSPPIPEEKGMVKKDPFLMTEAELRGKTFDNPFFYPEHRKIQKKGRKAGRNENSGKGEQSSPEHP